MDLAEALEIVIGRTGHERFRALCDPSSDVYDPGYAAIVMEMAGAPEVDRTHAPTLAQSLAIRTAVRDCPWRDPVPNCGCSGMARCAIGKGKGGDVSHADCWECCREEVTLRVRRSTA